jgi:formylmethanofuran dehydrogenase subunit C
MSGWRLTLRQAPTLTCDARALQPAALAGLTAEAVAHLALPHGNDTLPLGELFTIEPLPDAGTAGAVRLELQGDLSRFDRLGWAMGEGELHIDGNVGHQAGGGMSGGRLHITGSAGDLTGCALRGGWLEVLGSTGDLAASALPGDMDGMSGGTFVVRGNAGARLGDRMRRGTLVVFGDAGDFPASRMVAGTLALGGRCGAHPAYGMRRGSVVFAGPQPLPGLTFTPVHSNAAVFWQLLARDLAQFGGPFAGLAGRPVTRHAGDLAVQGRGELLFPVQD